jgi:hypothetical protein
MMKGIERHLNYRRTLPRRASAQHRSGTISWRLRSAHVPLARPRMNSFANQCFQRTVKMLRILPSAEGPRWASKHGVLNVL